MELLAVSLSHFKGLLLAPSRIDFDLKMHLIRASAVCRRCVLGCPKHCVNSFTNNHKSLGTIMAKNGDTTVCFGSE